MGGKLYALGRWASRTRRSTSVDRRVQRRQKQQNCDGASSSCRLVEVKILELQNLSVVFIISESEAELGLGILKFVYKWWGVICSIQSLQILLSEGLLHQFSDVICPITESNAQTFSLQVCRERSRDVAADASQNLQ